MLVDRMLIHSLRLLTHHLYWNQRIVSDFGIHHYSISQVFLLTEKPHINPCNVTDPLITLVQSFVPQFALSLFFYKFHLVMILIQTQNILWIFETSLLNLKKIREIYLSYQGVGKYSVACIIMLIISSLMPSKLWVQNKLYLEQIFWNKLLHYLARLALV